MDQLREVLDALQSAQERQRQATNNVKSESDSTLMVDISA